jgi:hypothetical protein
MPQELLPNSVQAAEVQVATSPAEVRTLLVEALRDIADPSIATSVVLDKTLRIARLRRDASSLLWLVMEAHTSGDRYERDRLANELRPYFADEHADGA